MNWTNQTFKQLAERAAWRAHLKPRKKQEASSSKPQAASATKRTQLKNKIKKWKEIYINDTRKTTQAIKLNTKKTP